MLSKKYKESANHRNREFLDQKNTFKNNKENSNDLSTPKKLK